MNQAYWFCLEPYVHTAIRQDNLLLYNTLSGKYLEYKGCGKIANILKKLVSARNLLVVKLSNKDLKDPVIQGFIKKVRKYFMGDLLEVSSSKGKPIQFMPMLKIHSMLSQDNGKTSFALGRNLMQSLKECSIYITNYSTQETFIPGDAQKQFLFSINNRAGQELNLEHLKIFLNESALNSLYRINILGGDIFCYSRFQELFTFLAKLPGLTVFHSHFIDFIKTSKHSKGINFKSLFSEVYSNIYLKILVNFPIDYGHFDCSVQLTESLSVSVEYLFVVSKDEHIRQVEELVSKYRLSHYSVQPYFNGKNLWFFKKNVFIKKADIFRSPLGMKEIFQRSAINPLHFGKLFILANGNIYANLNKPKLGRIRKDSIYDVVYKEICWGKSWRLLRKNVKPCKSCLYNALCPPISNYELVLKKYDLCNIGCQGIEKTKNKEKP